MWPVVFLDILAPLRFTCSMEPVSALVIVAVVAIIVVGVIAVVLVIPRNAKLEVDARRRRLKLDTTAPLRRRARRGGRKPDAGGDQ
jgi:hypothetical protein